MHTNILGNLRIYKIVEHTDYLISRDSLNFTRLKQKSYFRLRIPKFRSYPMWWIYALELL